MNTVQQQNLTPSEWESIAIDLISEGCTNEKQLIVSLKNMGCPDKSARLAAREAKKILSIFLRNGGLKLIAGGVIGMAIFYYVFGNSHSISVKSLFVLLMSAACILIGAFKLLQSFWVSSKS